MSERLRLKEATENSTPTQWGCYVERNDDGAWVPLILEMRTKADALDWLGICPVSFRNARLVKRSVTPWRLS